LSRTRRSLRRARTWRWEPPGAETAVAAEHARQRWAEARAKAIAWAVDVTGDPRVVYLDTETTGFGPRAEIVDIAVVSAAGEVLLESLVRPSRRIPADAIAIHGITDEDVAGAPAWCDLYGEVRHVLDGRRIVVYNVTFDRQMVSQACGQYALESPAADWDCAMRRYAGFYGSWDIRKRWYRFQKLEQAVLAFGAEPGGHRAAADAFACRAVVLGMAATPPPEPAPDGADGASQQSRAEPVAIAAVAVPGSPLAPPVDPLAGTPDPTGEWVRAASVFLNVLEAFPADLRERPGACGVWSARQVAAHCAGWEWEAARRLRLIAADPGIADAVYDVDGFNAASVAVRARQGWSATLDDLTKGSAALGTAAATIPRNARAREWLRRRAADFDTHATGLRCWLASEATAGVSRER
jgi:DNA polymerase-3 subunit epsilon